MGKLSHIRTAEAIKAFKQAGFMEVSQKGSHLKMRRVTPDGQTQTITIPVHRFLKEGTLKNGILKPIGMSAEEFLELL